MANESAAIKVPEESRRKLEGLKGLYINNSWRGSSSGGFFRHICPIDRVEQARVPLAGAADIDEAVTAARAAAPAWRAFPPDQRAQLLHRVADLIAENAEVLGEPADQPHGFRHQLWAKYLVSFR